MAVTRGSSRSSSANASLASSHIIASRVDVVDVVVVSIDIEFVVVVVGVDDVVIVTPSRSAANSRFIRKLTQFLNNSIIQSKSKRHKYVVAASESANTRDGVGVGNALFGTKFATNASTYSSEFDSTV